VAQAAPHCRVLASDRRPRSQTTIADHDRRPLRVPARPPSGQLTILRASSAHVERQPTQPRDSCRLRRCFAARDLRPALAARLRRCSAEKRLQPAQATQDYTLHQSLGPRTRRERKACRGGSRSSQAGAATTAVAEQACADADASRGTHAHRCSIRCRPKAWMRMRMILMSCQPVQEQRSCLSEQHALVRRREAGRKRIARSDGRQAGWQAAC
jgi:hypothetical protein